MDIHADCIDRCQIQEHKGYRKCSETSGECEMLRGQKNRVDDLVATIKDIALTPYRLRDR